MEGNDIPRGNSNCVFFADMIVLYDGSALSEGKRAGISIKVRDIISEAKKQPQLLVDFSRTNSQSDDPVDTLPMGYVLFDSRDRPQQKTVSISSPIWYERL